MTELEVQCEWSDWSGRSIVAFTSSPFLFHPFRRSGCIQNRGSNPARVNALGLLMTTVNIDNCCITTTITTATTAAAVAATATTTTATTAAAPVVRMHLKKKQPPRPSTSSVPPCSKEVSPQQTAVSARKGEKRAACNRR